MEAVPGIGLAPGLGVRNFIFFVVFFHFCRVWAAPDYRSGSPIMLGGQPSKEIKEVSFAELSTSVMYANDGKIKPAKAPIFILYAGTGGKVKEFGMSVSMGPLAQKIRKMGGDFFAFQNPYYFNHHLSDSERMPIINRFKASQEQTDWMAATIAHVFSLIPKDDQGRLSRPVWLITRSTGSLVAAQLIDDYEAGKAGASVIENVSGWVGTGMIDTEEPKLTEMLSLEEKYLRSRNDEGDLRDSDEIVRTAIKETAGSMVFASSDPQAPIREDHGRNHPKTIFTAGAHDDLFGVLDQIRVMERFARLHPALDISILGMVTGHNPVASVEYRDRFKQKVRFGMMERFEPILREIFAQPTGDVYNPGLKYVPTFGFTDTMVFRQCPDLMKLFSHRPL